MDESRPDCKLFVMFYPKKHDKYLLCDNMIQKPFRGMRNVKGIMLGTPSNINFSIYSFRCCDLKYDVYYISVKSCLIAIVLFLWLRKVSVFKQRRLSTNNPNFPQ